MKAIRFIILSLSILVSYNAHTQSQYYSELDKTIDKLIPKAKKNKLSEKDLQQLSISYHQANENDHKRIMELKSSGQADIWIEIYFRTSNINNRQNKIMPLPDKTKCAINFKALNLDNEISSSREKAELYICAKNNLLFKNPTPENITEASALTSALQKINPHNNNLDGFRIKLAVLPSEHILFRVATPIELYLPQDLAKTILDFNESTIYGIPFDVVENKGTDYDLMIRVMIDEKHISPEKVESVTFEEKKDNFKVTVTDKTMIKSATLKGKIQIIDVENDDILINTPYDISSTFSHQYAEISGDKEACSEHTLQLLSSEVIDFPSDESLLKAVANDLNSILKSYYQKK